MNAGQRWTTPADIASRLRRRWEDGSLLAGYGRGEPFAPVEIPLRGPRPSQVGDDLNAVRRWVGALDSGRHDDRRYCLIWQPIGGRAIGHNRLPSRAVVSSYDQAWALLGVIGQVRQFDHDLATIGDHAAVRDWVLDWPLRALQLRQDLPALIAAFDWLDAHRDSGRYLREISAPGVDTKFAERHRATLAAMLGVPGTASGFLGSLGLRAKPDLLRLRPARGLGLPPPLTELALRASEAALLELAPTTALVVENEITYLSVPIPPSGIVIWGKGFEVDRVGRLPWLAEAEVLYWGDLDTHGFAILDRLRAWLPQARSVLMDRDTLLAHRERWGTEDRPATSTLRRLTAAEHSLFAELVEDVHGPRIRLEQERIDWTWALQRIGGRACPDTDKGTLSHDPSTSSGNVG